MTISFSGNTFSVKEAVPGKYLNSGVLGESLQACEPIIQCPYRRNTELIAEFEELLNGNPSEEKLESFLKANFRQIFGFKYDRIESQVWLRFPELDIS